LTAGESRTGQARCTITDNVSATYTVDVEVSITRTAPTVTAPTIGLSSTKISPTDASVAFQFDNDGRWYSSVTTAAPTTDRGTWVSPVDYAGDYQIRITRTGGTETVFTSGPALGGSNWHNLSSDQLWRLTVSTNGNEARDIVFTIDIRRVSDSVIVSTTTGNTCSATVEI
jgi:hypothetical protein